MQTISEILEFLKQKDTNIRNISKETGISSDKLYSWRQGRGLPKADDTKILLEWAAKGPAPAPKQADKHVDTAFGDDFKDKYIKILEDYNRELKDKIDSNLQTALNNQLATASLLESVLTALSLVIAPGDEKAQAALKISLHTEAIRRLTGIKKTDSSIKIDSEDILLGS